MKKYLIASSLLTIVLLIGCFQNTKQNQDDEFLKQAKEENKPNLVERIHFKRQTKIAQEFQMALVTKLTTALNEGGVINALSYCNQHALAITDSLSKQHGATISRVSHKPRNPQNAANTYEEQLIDSYQQQIASGADPQPVTENQDGVHTFYTPIVIRMPLCLKCHGQKDTDILPEDFIMISTLYPYDMATGFKMNDVRGLLKIQITDNEPAL